MHVEINSSKPIDQALFLIPATAAKLKLVASLGGGGAPRVTPSRGNDTRRKDIFVAEFTKNSGQMRSDR